MAPTDPLLCMICCTSFRPKNGHEDELNQKAIVEALCEFGDTVLVSVQPFFTQPKEESKSKPKAKKHRKSGSVRIVGKKRPKSMKGTTLQDEIDKEDATKGHQIEDEADEDYMERGARQRIQSILASCNEDGTRVSVCEKCVETMKNTASARNRALEIESKVRKVQMYLVGLLKCLQVEMDDFYNMMESIEGKLKNSDVTELENQLNFKGTKKSQFTRPIVNKPQVNKYTIRRERVLRLRRHIVDAAEDVRELRTRISAVVDVDDPAVKPYIRRCLESSQNNAPRKKRKTANEDDFAGPTVNEVLSDDDNGNDRFPESVTSSADHEEIGIKQEPEHNDSNNSPMDEDNDGEGISMDDFFENLREEEIPRPPRRRTTAKRQIRYAESSGTEEDSESESSEASEHGWDSDYDPLQDLTTSALKRVKREEFESKLADLSTFKRNVLKNFIRRKNQSLAFIQSREALDATPLERYMAQLEFHEKDRSVSLCKIRIGIVESGDFTGLQCSKCEFQVSCLEKDPTRSMETVMSDHIIASHMEAYICPECGMSLKSSRRYSRHVTFCANTSICDICGKTVRDGEKGLRQHRFTHMNREEKEAAIAAGLRVPVPNKELKHFCSQCGKGFTHLSALTNHEDTHKDREERGLTMCPICGKQFLEQGFLYHSRASDCAEQLSGKKLNPVQCSICNKTLKNQVSLRLHKKKVHSDNLEKKFVCGTCGKAFKFKEGLTTHEKLHSGLKPYKCSKCGQAFAASNNRKRHETTCGRYARRSNAEEDQKQGHMETTNQDWQGWIQN